jgi:LuxR family maltose regulon positive regulatory protein
MQHYPLLQTKLYVPPIRPELVSRPRLIERLDTGLRGKLTVLSAPAGFGKTTLVTQWMKSAQCLSTWLSLDDRDNDAARFLVYFVAALRTVEANIGKGAFSALQSPQPPPAEVVLTSLVNDVAALPDRVVLVLDDYHLIATRSIHDALTFLLQHLPPQMHLVIATREDPDLPLARLRARCQLTELRVNDLRFTPSEAAEFLNQVMGLNLSTEEVTALEIRTEGWIAGLQLAALSMQGREDVSGFIRAFAGDNRYIMDYLGEELLFRGARLPKMQGVFGRWDWAANGLLFGLYHLHQPWGLLGSCIDGLLFTYPARRFRSTWMAIIIRSGQSVFFIFLILGLVLGLA